LPDLAIVVTCEHASAHVPARWAAALCGARPLLGGHHAFDAGAALLARDLARTLRAPLFLGTATRLLVDLNRAPTNPGRFSSFTRALASEDRARIMSHHYWPYRLGVEEAVRTAPPPVLHLAVHSFTPVLRGRPRPVDVGLLYDPARPRERRLAIAWQGALHAGAPALRVARNRPYRGTSDGLTTALRRHFADRRYAGVEIEVNQAIVRGAAARWRALRRLLVRTAADLRR
jgi:predicted N-formylglutamate amidohydrolase